MVNATVENEPVIITVKDGEITTVPTGETWKVSFSLSAYEMSDPNDREYENTRVLVNGAAVMDVANSGSVHNSDITLTGGDTVEVEAAFGSDVNGLLISGFVVN